MPSRPSADEPENRRNGSVREMVAAGHRRDEHFRAPSVCSVFSA